MAHLVVVGPGALGTLFAVRLMASGHEVTMACRTAATAKQLAQDGLVLEDDQGRHHMPCQTATKPRDVASYDGVIIATKCAAAAKAIKMWRQSGVPMICLQNGVMGPELAQIAGPDYIPCTVGFPASWEGPGHSVETGTGTLVLGSWPSGPPTQGVAQAGAWLASVAPVRLTKNMLGVAWSKLLINSVGSAAVVSGTSLGELLQRREAKELFLAIVSEGHAAGRAAGISFEKVAGFHPALMERLGRIGGRPAQHLALSVIARKYRRMKSSSLQSLQRGQKTEVQWLNQHIVRTGEEVGVPTPVNRRLVATIEALERGEIEPSPELLARLT